MPQYVNIPADAEPVDTSLEAIEAELEDAQVAFDKLVNQRRAKRSKLSREAFREYNEQTAEKQLAVSERLVAAQKAAARAAGRSEQRVEVGGASEASEAGGS